MLKTFQDFYAQKDYANALLVLEKNKDKVEPGLWHYNLGTLKAQMQNHAEARFHFLKAEQKGLQSEEVLHNRTLVENELELTRLEQPLTLKDYLIDAGLWAQKGVFTTVSLVMVIAAIVHLRKKRDYKIAGVYGVLIGLPLLVSFWVSSWPKAIVVEPQLVQEGPSVIFASRGEIPPGVLIISRRNGDWREIIYPSRFAGWVKDNGLKHFGE